MQPQTLQKPAGTLAQLMNEVGIKMSVEETKTILSEITNNKERSYKNLSNIVKAIDKFRKVASK